MKIGCSPAYMFAHFQENIAIENLEWGIRRVAELQFSGLQLETYDSSQVALYTDENITKIGTLYEKLGLESSQFVAHSVKDGIHSFEIDERNKGLEELRCLAEVCRKLGIIHTMTIPTAPPKQMVVRSREVYPGASEAVLAVPEGWTWSRIWNQYLDVLRRCLDIVTAAGFRLALEPVPYSLISHTDTFLLAADRLGSDRFGMNLDTGHIFAQKESLPLTIEKLGPKLFGTHISDNDGVTHDHWKVGSGNIPWPDVVAAFKKIGYDGALDIEINVVDKPDEAYVESKVYLESLLSV